VELGEGAGEQAIMTGLVVLIEQRKAEPIKSNNFFKKSFDYLDRYNYNLYDFVTLNRIA